MLQAQIVGYTYSYSGGGKNSYICFELKCSCRLYEFGDNSIKFIPCKIKHQKLSDVLKYRIIKHGKGKVEHGI